MNLNLRIEYLPVGSLKPYKNNTRKHEEHDIKQIMQSIMDCGFCDPIGIWSDDNLIVEGHGRLQAAIRLGMESVPCVRLDHLDDEGRRKYTILHNKTAEQSTWDSDILPTELIGLDFSAFGFDFGVTKKRKKARKLDAFEQDAAPPMQHNVFENQDTMQFECIGFYGMPQMKATQTTGEKMLRFMDWKEVNDPENYIAHFYYDDYKFMSAWREPEKYLDRLRRFKAVISPDFSLYTDFPRALQILSCYRRQWCGAFWQYHGIDVIPDVVWGDKDSFSYCFDGIPQHSTVAVSSVGVKRDNEWNNKEGDMFRAGYEEMMKRLKPTTVLFYGDMIDGLEGNIIRFPSYYEQKRQILNERMNENGKRT